MDNSQPKDVDELFPPQPKSIDELFPSEIERQRSVFSSASPVHDLIFGDTTVNPIARVLDAFGQGAKQSWGADAAGLSPETTDYLKKVGIFNDYAKGDASVIKAANESLIRPAAVAMDTAWRGLQAGFGGAQAAIAQSGEEAAGTAVDTGLKAVSGALGTVTGTGGEQLGTAALGHDVAGAFEAFPTGLRAPTGIPHPVPHPMLEEIQKAKELGTLSEAVDGTPPPPEPSVPISTDNVAPPKPAGMPVDLFAEPRDTTVGTPAAPKAEAAPVEPTPGLPEGDAAVPETATASSPIADDVAAKLVAAGRPEAEAQASGQLIASHYEARAERFGGARGTAEQLYAAEGPDIRGADGAAPAGSEPIKPIDEGDAATADAVPSPTSDGGGAVQATPNGFRYSLETSSDRFGKEGEIAIAQIPEAATKSQGSFAASQAEGSAGKFVAIRKGQDGAAGTLSESGSWIDNPSKPRLFDTRAEAETAVKTKLGISGKQPDVPKSVPQLKTALRGRAAADPQTWSLYEFLAKEGGLKPTADLKSILGGKNPFVPGFGPLLRPTGLSMDEALTRAKENAYVIDPNDIQHVPGSANAGELTKSANDLQDMVAEEGRGNKQYRVGQEAPEAKVNPEEERGSILDELHRQVNDAGGKVDPALEDRVVEMVQKEGVRDVHDAYERAILEDHDRHEALLNDRRAIKETADIRGHDAPDSGAASHSLEEFVDDSGYTWASEQEAREANVGQSSDHGANDREAELELNQIKRGKINLRKDAKPIITLFKDANASTFIHETGHQWLEELMKDSEHPLAPADLKEDAIKVLDWLGVKDADAIKTSHHEKFARGFERYMMEGKAPNQALANVFAKFKNWLTKIYQTVTRLKSPINDDIRGVFDRLLTLHPEDVKIEPESPAKTFADLHEADAVNVPPEMAHPAAETIEGERDSVAARHIPEDNNARLENTSEQARRSEAGNQQPASDADAAGPDGGETGSPEAPGEVGAGGDEAATAGPRTSAQPRTQDPVSPHDKFPDKAGNIRLENINTPDDVLQVLRDSANRNNDFLDQRRDVVSDAQALSLAEAMGMDAAFLDTKKIGAAWNKEEIFALENLLIKSSQDVHDAMNGTDVIAYGEAKARLLMIHDMVQGKASAARAEAGRALQAYAALKKMKGSGEAHDLAEQLKAAGENKTLFQLEQEMKFGARLQTPQQTAKFVNDTAKGNFRNAILEYYINALISGPFTHTRYAIGNAVGAIFTPLVEIPLASAVGKAREVIAGEKIDRVHFGEAGAQLYAIIKGSRDGLTSAIEAYQTGVSPPLPSEKVSPHFSQPNRAIPGRVGEIINLPSKSVAGIHSFFKTLRYEQNIQGQAFRMASNEGLTGDAFNARIAELTTSPTETMMTDATTGALRELYMAPTEYHSFGGALTRVFNHPSNLGLAAKIIVPFMKIGTQITRNAFIDRTPLGIVSKDVRENISGGGVKADLQAGKIAAGLALIGATVGMALEGNVTGDGPTDPAQRKVWLLSHKPNTIQIGDVTMSYQGLGSLGMLMRFAANMTETTHALGDKDMATLAVAYFEGITTSVLDENFMRGVKDMTQAMYHFKEYGPSYLKNQITNWIPWSVGMSQVARKIDPYSRETHGIFQAAQAKIPWLSEALMPRRDMFGEPIRNGGPNPDYANDPVVKAMDDLHMGVGKMSKKISGVELNEQQYDDVSRIAGRMAKTRLNAMVGIIGNPTIPIAQRIEMINKTIETSRSTARQIVMMQNPAIIQQSNAAKVAKLTTR